MISDVKQAEYESLREEILAYIRQRFDVMVVVVTASTLLFGYGLENKQGAAFLCAYVMLFLAVSHMAWSDYYAFLNASYLRVFHEGEASPGWESRLARFRARRTHRIAQTPYQVLYWGIAIIASTAAFWYINSWHRFLFPTGCFAAWATFALYVSGVLQKRHRAGPEQLEEWRRIREEEEQSPRSVGTLSIGTEN